MAQISTVSLGISNAILPLTTFPQPMRNLKWLKVQIFATSVVLIKVDQVQLYAGRDVEMLGYRLAHNPFPALATLFPIHCLLELESVLFIVFSKTIAAAFYIHYFQAVSMPSLYLVLAEKTLTKDKSFTECFGRKNFHELNFEQRVTSRSMITVSRSVLLQAHSSLSLRFWVKTDAII